MSDNQDVLRLANALEAIHENNSDSLLSLNVIRQAGPELRRLVGENAELLEALRIAEAALTEIEGADRERDNDLTVCIETADEALPPVRAAIAKSTRA